MFFNVYLLLLIVVLCNLVESFPLIKAKLNQTELREGDILVSRNDPRRFRYGLQDPSKRWPSGHVPYLFSAHGEFYDHEKSLIRQAMDEIEKHTCIKFIEVNQNQVNNDYLVITSNFGCFSAVGREGGPQELSLSSPICLSKGIILHELVHSLGFVHEQSRVDRDDHVKIMWENIDKEKYNNFDKYDQVVDLKIPYDFQSLMHYEYNAFAKSEELASIKPIDQSIALSDLGKAKKLGILTESDLKKINKYYECVV